MCLRYDKATACGGAAATEKEEENWYLTVPGCECVWAYEPSDVRSCVQTIEGE